MTFLLISILCSSGIAIFFSWSDKKQTNWSGIIVVNYCFALLVSLFFLFQKTPLFSPLKTSWGSFIQDFPLVISYSTPFSVEGSMFYTLFIGIIGGIFFFLSLIIYRLSISRNGASVSGTFAKLGMAVPILLSLLFWKFIPNILQWLGIILSFVAIIFLYNKKDNSFRFDFVLIALLLTMGFAEFNNKLFQQYSVGGFNDFYLLIVFGTAFVCALSNQCIRKTAIRKKEIFFGLAIGLFNYGSSFFLIKSLSIMPATLVFPIFSSGSIVCISIVSGLWFKEKLRTTTITAIILAIVGVILMSLPS